MKTAAAKSLAIGKIEARRKVRPRYKALADSIIRIGPSKTSDRAPQSTLVTGTVITVLDQSQDGDTTRVMFKTEGVPGWVSVTAPSGKPMLELLPRQRESNAPRT